GVLFVHLARAPDLDGLGAARLAAGVAARVAAIVLAAELGKAIAQRRTAGHLTALPVALVHAAALHDGHLLAGPDRLADFPLFHRADILANRLGHLLALGHHLVDGARALLIDVLGPVGRVVLLNHLPAVDRLGGGVPLGHPLVDEDRSRAVAVAVAIAVAIGRVILLLLGGSIVVAGGIVVGPDGPLGRGQDHARQQGEAEALPDHACF